MPKTDIPKAIQDLVLESASIFKELDYWADRYNEIVNDLNALGYWQFGHIESVTVACQCKGAGHYSITTVDDLFQLMDKGLTPHFNEDIGFPRSARRKTKPGHVKRLALVKKLGDACQWACVYCGLKGDEKVGPDTRTWHVDHLFAKVNGGDYLPDNLVLSCATCNIKKNRLLLCEFIAKRTTSA